MPRPNPPRSLGGEEGLARRVAYERERRGWSTEGLAKRVTDAGCPINQSAIWKIENGNPPRRITYDEALAFARVFDLPLDELSIPPEIAASATLRQLVAQFLRMTEELAIRNSQQLELLREMNRIAAQFPEARPLMDEVHQRLTADADKVIRELGST